jgi:uncharacterized protein
MTEDHGRFVWHELLTTDVASAEVFYRQVLGWDASDASTPEFTYRVLTADAVPVSGLMALPLAGVQRGAAPRWVGYVAVDDLDASMNRLKALGGTVYVPPTDSNIGRIAIIADPQTATLALVQRLTIDPSTKDRETNRETIMQSTWNELLTAESRQAFAFYSSLVGWRDAGNEPGPTDGYQLFAAGNEMLGGMFTKPAQEPFSFWLYYFHVADMTVASQQVRAHGGKVVRGPAPAPDGSGIWIAHCVDPQGAVFALQGKRSGVMSDDAPSLEINWAAEWGGFTSRGRIFDKRAPIAEPAPELRTEFPKKPRSKR